ncbi:MAG: hypothetical protein HC888_02550 [Candidatus Competibacteraceae bacterium]|nr:hypothetical protein [Candidatus Competibacteraceae bacterium]
MSKGLIGLAAVGGLLVLVALLSVVWAIELSNNEVGLRNQFEAVRMENRTAYDNMWKTISEKFNISETYKEGLREVVLANASGRDGGSFAKAVTEAVPNLDPSVYRDVMATIEGKRDFFKRRQDTQIDIKRAHDDLRLKFPSSLVVGGRPALVLELVTSGRTNDAFQSGEDNKLLIPRASSPNVER